MSLDLEINARYLWKNGVCKHITKEKRQLSSLIYFTENLMLIEKIREMQMFFLKRRWFTQNIVFGQLAASLSNIRQAVT